jgi:DNA-directed RNA polymerase subunit L
MAFLNFKSKTSNQLSFVIKDIDLSIVNSLRRIILAEIPNVAVETDIKIHKNTGALHNEFLAHRISLIPMCFSEDEVENFDPSKYKFVLKKKNTTTDILPVTTKDIEIYEDDKRLVIPHIFPANPITGDHILITKLRPNLYEPAQGEEIDIEFRGEKNVAMVNARWSPVSQCSFGNVIDMEAANKKFAEKKDPQFWTLEAFRYFKKNAYDEPCEFDFMIESECALTPRYLFGKAMEVLRDKLDAFLAKLMDDKYVIKKLNIAECFYEINITNESYTLLNVLQACIYNYNMRQLKDSPLQYIGYYLPHPLEDTMVLKIKFVDGYDDLKTFLDENVKKIKQDLETYMATWKKDE